MKLTMDITRGSVNHSALRVAAEDGMKLENDGVVPAQQIGARQPGEPASNDSDFDRFIGLGWKTAREVVFRAVKWDIESVVEVVALEPILEAQPVDHAGLGVELPRGERTARFARQVGQA